MGFGFNLFFIFILLPIIGIICLAILISYWKKGPTGILKRIGIIITIPIALIILLQLVGVIFSKSKVKAKDLYGDYVIDKSKFDPSQAKWQYEHFKFTLAKDNKMLFHIMENEKILRTITTDFEIRNGYCSARLKLLNENPTFHILYQNPTLYRTNWSFYYVFYSPLYGNMFFKKANWFGN